MPLSLKELRALIQPSKTALLLGAGISVQSGAPTGRQLAHQLWRSVAKWHINFGVLLPIPTH